jgi:hypothetical protein
VGLLLTQREFVAPVLEQNGEKASLLVWNGRSRDHSG